MEEKLVLVAEADFSALAKEFEKAARSVTNAARGLGDAIQTNIGEETSRATDKMSEGLTQAARRMTKTGNAASEAFGEAFESTLGNLKSAFVDFARTGELNVRDMVNAIIADLARISFDSFIKGPLEGLFNFFSKSLLGGFGNNFGGGGGGSGDKALGGPVSFGRPYIVGEQGRELFVPETSGRIIPNHQLGGGSIILNVQATDAASFQRSETQIAAMLNRLVSRGNRNL
ncbi:hypothetical protein JYU02_00105 [bacterium AH-315-P15]|nr:hypothetical protein [bacterium AH-315-P15]